MHLSPFDDLPRGALATRESQSRRIGVIISILFLASVGTVATLTSTPAGARAQADARVTLTALPSTATR